MRCGAIAALPLIPTKGESALRQERPCERTKLELTANAATDLIVQCSFAVER